MSTESAPSVLQTRANIRRVIDTMVTRLAESDAVVNIGDYALCIASLAEAHQRLSPSYAPGRLFVQRAADAVGGLT
jgi:hypothetical protein